MGSGALAVHGGGGHLPILETLRDVLQRLLVVVQSLLRNALNVYTALVIFPNGIGLDFLIKLHKPPLTRSMICSL
jgi:hypothetical protein